MTFRLVHSSNAQPMSIICDPSAEFQAGMVAEHAVIMNTVMGTVSNGTAPLGVIDDVKTKAFTNISWNEEIIVSATGTTVSNVAIMKELKRPNIVASSFTSTVSVTLNPVNGVITFPIGTTLNIDLTGSGTANGIRAIVNYTYQVANVPGDDSTQGSGRMTVWYNRMVFQTDQYETNQQYPLRANLFVSELGYFTSRKPSEIHPAVGMVTAPPSALNSMLEILWF